MPGIHLIRGYYFTYGAVYHDGDPVKANIRQNPDHSITVEFKQYWCEIYKGRAYMFAKLMGNYVYNMGTLEAYKIIDGKARPTGVHGIKCDPIVIIELDNGVYIHNEDKCTVITEQNKQWFDMLGRYHDVVFDDKYVTFTNTRYGLVKIERKPYMPR